MIDYKEVEKQLSNIPTKKKVIARLKEGIRPLNKEEIHDKTQELLNQNRRGQLSENVLIKKLNELYNVK